MFYIIGLNLKSHKLMGQCLIVCIDNKIYKYLDNHSEYSNIHKLSIDIPDFTPGKLWILRVELVLYLLDGINLIHSDIDCIWRQNPLNYGLCEYNLNKYNLIASQEHIGP